MARKSFIAPHDVGVGTITRCLHLPASQAWLAVFNAALLETSQAWNYEQLYPTDLTPDEAAAIGFAVYEDWLSGDCSLDCDDVLACLTVYTAGQKSAGTYNVNKVDIDDETAVETRFPSVDRAQKILPDPSPCSLDEIWAGILEVVTRIDGNGRDFWEIIVAKTDVIERIGEIIALVPIFGDMIGEGLGLLAEIAPTMKEKYEAHSTQSTIEEIACDLFQTVCSDCRYPTYQEVFDYYSGRSALGAQAWAEIALSAALDVLIGASGSSPAIVYMTTNIVQSWVLSLGATWIKTFGVEFVGLWAQLGANDANDDWETLCGSCGDSWCHTWLNGNGQGPWAAVPADFGNNCTASYDATNDMWVGCLPATNAGRSAEIGVGFSENVNITKLVMKYAFKVTRATPSDHARISAPAGATRANREYEGTPTGTGELTWEGNADVMSIRFKNLVGNYNSGDGAYAWITEITVCGTGPDPFV